MKFEVTWTAGKTEIFEQSDCSTADQLANTMWGAPSAEHVATTYGVVIRALDSIVQDATVYAASNTDFEVAAPASEPESPAPEVTPEPVAAPEAEPAAEQTPEQPAQ